MYPYCGHLAWGLAGVTMFPESAPFQIAWFAGSLAPDGPATLQSIADRLRGKPELPEQSPEFLKVQEIVNTIPVWGLLTVCSHLFSPLFPLFAAYLIHLIVDVFTHCGEEYEATDPSYLWPLDKPRLGKVFGLWEYRNGVGLKMPKVPELVFSAIILGVPRCTSDFFKPPSLEESKKRTWKISGPFYLL